MAYKATLKTTFEPDRVIRPFYTGGGIQISQDGLILASCLGEDVLLTNFETGHHLARIEGDGEAITALALTPDASYLAVCSRSLSMRIYVLSRYDDSTSEIETRPLKQLKPHVTPVVTTAVDSTGTLLATGGADGTAKIWDIRGGYVTHTFHGHSGVVSALLFFQIDVDDQVLVKKTGNGRTNPKNTSSSESSHTSVAGYRLASGGEDGVIRVWDLSKRKTVAMLNSHVSVVRNLDFAPVQGILLSGSRDKTAILWDCRTWQVSSTVAVLEAIEASGFLENGRFFYTAGETARLRLWETRSSRELTEDQPQGTETDAIVDVLHRPGLPFIVSVHADQALISYDISRLIDSPALPQYSTSLPILRRVSGCHDEIIDLAYVGRNKDMMALATNQEDIKLISLKPSSNATTCFGADVTLLKGHQDIVITLDTDWSGYWLATGAKDNTARIWQLDPEKQTYTCYATLTGHAESIGAVALPRSVPAKGSVEYEKPLDTPPKFLITGSQDKTIKRWDLSPKSGRNPRVAYTRKAHDKEINAIQTSFSSTSPLFASASQDRTVRIWDVEAGEVVGVLRGHKRGVWTVAFSPLHMPNLTVAEDGAGASSARGMVVTGSGDKTVKIWSLSDYSCLRTFEGHANSVLKVAWLPPPSRKASDKRRVQVASAAGDGLVKVWDAQSGECAATLDNHIDRVWALAVKPVLHDVDDTSVLEEEVDEQEVGEDADSHSVEIVSGSADSTLTFWTDTTALTAREAVSQLTIRAEQDQELQSHIRAQNFFEAITLAMQLNHPQRLLDLFTTLAALPPQHQDAGSLTGKREVDNLLRSLSDEALWNFLKRIRDWNTNNRTQFVASRVMHALLRLCPKDRLLALRRRKADTSQLHDAENDPRSRNGFARGELQQGLRSQETVYDILDGLKAYTERHATKLEKSAEERFVLLWMLQCMDDVIQPMGDLVRETR